MTLALTMGKSSTWSRGISIARKPSGRWVTLRVFTALNWRARAFWPTKADRSKLAANLFWRMVPTCTTACRVHSMGSSGASAESWEGDAAELANQMAMASLAQYQSGAAWGGAAGSSTWQ